MEGQPGTKREYLSHREHQVVVPRNSHQSKSFMKTVTVTEKKRAHLGNHVLDEKPSITNEMSLLSENESDKIDKEITITKKKKVAPQAISLLNNGWDASEEALQQQAEKKRLKGQSLQGFILPFFFFFFDLLFQDVALVIISECIATNIHTDSNKTKITSCCFLNKCTLKLLVILFVILDKIFSLLLLGKEDIKKKIKPNNSNISTNDDVYSSIGSTLRHT